ncbi:SAF domain-containing protein [Actinoallomurus sp. NBC_01490]|uniref:SAF domain-containing protein n=1 Tax=Actinoallomurus sp. NBC_01490 TaxID=2903557 RepID=UPI002E31D65C|nr:SAF domain-containing protein [Actinoallomurus sp. NBC_01490]
MAGKSSRTYVQEFDGPTRSPGGQPGAGRGSLPPLPRQRRRRMLVLGVLLVLAGALAAGYLYTGMGDRVAVIVVARDVPVGTQLSAADVATTRVAVDGSVTVIPGRQLRQVVGRYAAVGLRKGTLLAASQLTGAVSPRPGQQVVPVAVKLDQLPARGLQPGDQVLVIATPGQDSQDQGASGGSSPPLTQNTPASVDGVSSPDADGDVRVDLVVDAQVGPAVVQQASMGRIGFVITSRAPR